MSSSSPTPQIEANLFRMNLLWQKLAQSTDCSQRVFDMPIVVDSRPLSSAAKTAFTAKMAGRQVVVVPKEYLFGRVIWEREETREWQIWQQCLEKCPKDLQSMITHARQIRDLLPEDLVQEMIAKYGDKLTPEELEAEFAHELGHVIEKHELEDTVEDDFRLSAAVGMAGTVVGVALTGALSGFLAGGLFAIALAVQPLLRKVATHKKRAELEARADSFAAKLCCEGSIRIYQREILVHLLAAKCMDSAAERLSCEQDGYPSDRCRLEFFGKKLHAK